MPNGLSKAQDLILRCCADPDADRSGQYDLLGESEAEELLDGMVQTRTASLVAHATRNTSGNSRQRDTITEIAKLQAVQNLKNARALVETLDLLQQSDFRPVVLKGVALAFGYYPDPSMRPLRDVDLLLPASEAEVAQALLLAQPDFELAQWAGRYGLEYGHQLPEIVHRPSGLVIEIHHRINARGWTHEQELQEMILDEARQIELLGAQVTVPSPEANLLHLVEHATLHHAFANGPLVMSDLVYLAEGGEIDWARIRAIADRIGLVRALALIIGAVDACSTSNRLSEAASVPTPEAEVIKAALHSMMMTSEQIAQHDQWRRQVAHSERGNSALRRAFAPDRYELAKFAKREPDTLYRWLGYPAWLAEKGARFWRTRNDADLVPLMKQRDSLIEWMNASED